MTVLAQIIGFASGFALMRYREPALSLLATSLIIDASLAPLTAIIAWRRGRSLALWVVLGFVLGMWALAFVLLFKPRAPNPAATGSDYPPASDAA